MGGRNGRDAIATMKGECKIRDTTHPTKKHADLDDMESPALRKESRRR
jgi:hypothetical protein